MEQAVSESEEKKAESEPPSPLSPLVRAQY